VCSAYNSETGFTGKEKALLCKQDLADCGASAMLQATLMTQCALLLKAPHNWSWRIAQD
jgi:hypothetical protein